MYIRWFGDQALGFYCRRCGEAVQPGRKCEDEIVFTPAQLNSLVSSHIKARHPDG